MPGEEPVGAGVSTVRIPVAGVSLPADVTLPEGATGLVVFAHGSGSSRRSGRNLEVAGVLHRAGLGTVLFDLLTEEEARRDAVDRSLRFDIGLLGRRLTGVVDDAAGRPELRGLPVGLFGASTGAAAALVAAAARPGVIRSVVSRGGRPDLAADALDRVTAPVLLIVGERDEQVLVLNRHAAVRLAGPHEVVVVPDATHLFGEPGALAAVAEHTARWFTATLGAPAPPPAS
jgi:putative phosphoribosyl transferase